MHLSAQKQRVHELFMQTCRTEEAVSEIAKQKYDSISEGSPVMWMSFPAVTMSDFVAFKKRESEIKQYDNERKTV